MKRTPVHEATACFSDAPTNIYIRARNTRTSTSYNHGTVLEYVLNEGISRDSRILLFLS